MVAANHEFLHPGDRAVGDEGQVRGSEQVACNSAGCVSGHEHHAVSVFDHSHQAASKAERSTS